MSEQMSFIQEWTESLLEQIETSYKETEYKDLFRGCAEYHYRHLNMEETLQKYIGDLTGFIEFISKEWGWIITFNPEKNEIIADENKNFCVCPIVANSTKKISRVLCHCSESFAEKMFTKVIGSKVEANVIQSVLAGDSSCVYRIKIK